MSFEDMMADDGFDDPAEYMEHLDDKMMRDYDERQANSSSSWRDDEDQDGMEWFHDRLENDRAHSVFSYEEQYNGYTLRGRMICRDDSGLKVIYQISAERINPPELFVLNCEAHPLEVGDIPLHKLESWMQHQALMAVKNLVSSRAFSNNTSVSLVFDANQPPPNITWVEA